MWHTPERTNFPQFGCQNRILLEVKQHPLIGFHEDRWLRGTFDKCVIDSNTKSILIPRPAWDENVSHSDLHYTFVRLNCCQPGEIIQFRLRF